MPDPSGALLIVSPGRWDEACFAVPAVRALQRTGWQIAVLCHPQQSVFWERIPGLPTIPSADFSRSLAKKISGAWKTAVVWEDGQLSQAVRKAKVPRSVGPGGESWAKWLSDPVELSLKPKSHRVEFYLDTARALGQPTNDPALFQPLLTGDQSKRLLLVPDSDFGPSHEWPLDRWEQLARTLRANGEPFEIATLPGGRNLGSTLVAQLDGVESVSVGIDSHALPLLGSYARVIAADGSLPHLASHAGSTCLTLFGPNDPVSRRPLGLRHATARHHVECAPCRLRECPLDRRCQNELTVERVLQVWRAS